MDSKSLAKIIKLAVREEIKRQMPILVREGIKKEMSKLITENPLPKKSEKQITDPFKLANAALANSRKGIKEVITQRSAPVPIKKSITGNPVIDEILSNTERFSKDHYVTENVSYPPQFEVEESTMKFNSNDTHAFQPTEDGGVNMDRHPSAPSTAPKTGMGVKTGLSGLDRILNRDNSELVKRFKK